MSCGEVTNIAVQRSLLPGGLQRRREEQVKQPPNLRVPGEIQNMATLVQKVGEWDADDIKRDLKVQKVIQSPNLYSSCSRTHIPHLPPLASRAFSRT